MADKIETPFVHASTEQSYLANKSNISDDSIVYIKDKDKQVAKGHEYQFVPQGGEPGQALVRGENNDLKYNKVITGVSVDGGTGAVPVDNSTITLKTGKDINITKDSAGSIVFSSSLNITGITGRMYSTSTGTTYSDITSTDVRYLWLSKDEGVKLYEWIKDTSASKIAKLKFEVSLNKRPEVVLNIEGTGNDQISFIYNGYRCLSSALTSSPTAEIRLTITPTLLSSAESSGSNISFSSTTTADKRKVLAYGSDTQEYYSGDSTGPYITGQGELGAKKIVAGTFNDTSVDNIVSIGDGTSTANHNAFEVRQNGEIYVGDTFGGGTYYDEDGEEITKPMISLQRGLKAEQYLGVDLGKLTYGPGGGYGWLPMPEWFEERTFDKISIMYLNKKLKPDWSDPESVKWVNDFLTRIADENGKVYITASLSLRGKGKFLIYWLHQGQVLPNSAFSINGIEDQWQNIYLDRQLSSLGRRYYSTLPIDVIDLINGDNFSFVWGHLDYANGEFDDDIDIYFSNITIEIGKVPLASDYGENYLDFIRYNSAENRPGLVPEPPTTGTKSNLYLNALGSWTTPAGGSGSNITFTSTSSSTQYKIIGYSSPTQEYYSAVNGGPYITGSGELGAKKIVAGSYNVSTTDSLLNVGNGTSASDLHNVLDVKSDGKVYVADPYGKKLAEYYEMSAHDWVQNKAPMLNLQKALKAEQYLGINLFHPLTASPEYFLFSPMPEGFSERTFDRLSLFNRIWGNWYNDDGEEDTSIQDFLTRIADKDGKVYFTASVTVSGSGRLALYWLHQGQIISEDQYTIDGFDQAFWDDYVSFELTPLGRRYHTTIGVDVQDLLLGDNYSIVWGNWEAFESTGKYPYPNIEYANLSLEFGKTSLVPDNFLNYFNNLIYYGSWDRPALVPRPPKTGTKSNLYLNAEGEWATPSGGSSGSSSTTTFNYTSASDKRSILGYVNNTLTSTTSSTNPATYRNNDVWFRGSDGTLGANHFVTPNGDSAYHLGIGGNADIKGNLSIGNQLSADEAIFKRIIYKDTYSWERTLFESSTNTVGNYSLQVQGYNIMNGMDWSQSTYNSVLAKSTPVAIPENCFKLTITLTKQGNHTLYTTFQSRLKPGQELHMIIVCNYNDTTANSRIYLPDSDLDGTIWMRNVEYVEIAPYRIISDIGRVAEINIVCIGDPSNRSYVVRAVS